MISAITLKDRMQLKREALLRCINGDFEGLKILIKELKDFSFSIPQKMKTSRVLDFSIDEREKEIAEYLSEHLKRPAEYCYRNAIHVGYLTVLENMMRNKDRHGFLQSEGLKLATTLGHVDIVKYIVPRLNDTAKIFVETALCISADNGHLEILKYLISQGADLHTRFEHPLRWAASEGHLEVVKYLVEQGANIHVLDEITLKWACEEGHLDIAKYLVAQGANVQACSGSTIRFCRHEEILEFLREQGVPS